MEIVPTRPHLLPRHLPGGIAQHKQRVREIDLVRPIVEHNLRLLRPHPPQETQNEQKHHAAEPAPSPAARSIVRIRKLRRDQRWQIQTQFRPSGWQAGFWSWQNGQ